MKNEKKYCIGIAHERFDEPTEIYYVVEYDGYYYSSARLNDMKEEGLQPFYFDLDYAVKFIENSIRSMMLGRPMICLAFEVCKDGRTHTLRD